MSKKPLNAKNYGSIGHLPMSRMGPGDHACHEGMAKIATQKCRTKHDRVIVQEKLDGSNVGVAKVRGKILPLQRSGYLADTSPFEQHHHFARWVEKHQERFDALLGEGERVCGEWLLQAHSTRYTLSHEPFVAFDLMTGSTRTPFDDCVKRLSALDFVMPYLIHQGGPMSVHAALDHLGPYGKHGAMDEIEGVVWRVETNQMVLPGKSTQRAWIVDFVVKYVRPDKVDGTYLPDISHRPIVWNIEPTELWK